MKHFRSKLILLVFSASVCGALFNTAINLDLITKLNNRAGIEGVSFEEESGEKGVESDSETETQNDFAKDVYRIIHLRQNQLRTQYYLQTLLTLFQRCKFLSIDCLDTANPPPEA
jgi:hypothetical protein